jgi:hypothetical protein
MKNPDEASLRLLVAELDKDVRDLAQLQEENRRAEMRIREGSTDSLDIAALAYTIHNLYCLMENYFLRIAKTFENNVGGDTWHRDLVRRMTIEVDGVRPALLDDETAAKIDELRAFRHVFRNVYQAPLRAERVRELQAAVPAIVEAFRRSHLVFVEKIRIIFTLT